MECDIVDEEMSVEGKCKYTVLRVKFFWGKFRKKSNSTLVVLTGILDVFQMS